MPLDVEKMKSAAKYLLGEHDFQSFCSARSQAEHTYRTIYSLDVEKEGDMITIRICGNGFLYNMVRIIVGTLTKVGMGVYSPEYVEEILEAKDRRKAGPKAPAQGLTLVGIEFEEKLEEKIMVENKECKYWILQNRIEEEKLVGILIERCEKEVLEGLIERNTTQAFRNGAKCVCMLMRKEIGEEERKDCWKIREYEYNRREMREEREIIDGFLEAAGEKNLEKWEVWWMGDKR